MSTIRISRLENFLTKNMLKSKRNMQKRKNKIKGKHLNSEKIFQKL